MRLKTSAASKTKKYICRGICKKLLLGNLNHKIAQRYNISNFGQKGRNTLKN